MAAPSHSSGRRTPPHSARPAAVPDASVADRAASGRACRSETPRSSHGSWAPPADRHDPIALLEEQAAERVPELVPIRYGRMSLSPFSFYRGAAYVMAADLAVTPQTGMRVQLCGDAHLANFGGFASPERQLLFDLVDFDETLPGPWEWDLKRLGTSVAVAGRENGFSTRRRIAIVQQLTREYREAMRRFATMGTLDVWYARASIADVREVLRSQASARQLKRFDKTLSKGRRKDHSRAFAKLAVADDGEPRIRERPRLSDATRRLFQRIGPGAVGAGASQINLLISTILASTLPTGAVSYLFYADRLNQLPLGIVGTRCCDKPYCPSSRATSKPDAKIKSAITPAARSSSACCRNFPAMIGLAVSGKRSCTSCSNTVSQNRRHRRNRAGPALLFIWRSGLFAGQNFCRRVFRPAHDTATPVKVALVAMAVNVLTSLALSHPLQHMGIALSNSVATWTNALILMILHLASKNSHAHRSPAKKAPAPYRCQRGGDGLDPAGRRKFSGPLDHVTKLRSGNHRIEPSSYRLRHRLRARPACHRCLHLG